MKKLLNILVLLSFLSGLFSPAKVFAAPVTAMELMPIPGKGVSLTPPYALAQLTGMVIDANDPFKFEFIVNRGDVDLPKDQKEAEYKKLVKYFLAALAVDDKDQWVNLSPYEKDRIIADNFGKTEMGRDLLAQDYLLKQLAASLTNPDTSLGKEFWDKVFKQAYEKYGTTDVPVTTFNKVWIVPDKAEIYQKDNSVFVVNSRLKVMTEEDYVAQNKNKESATSQSAANGISSEKTKLLINDMMRDIIIPAIEKEVNEGRNFAPLRQVFSGMLLATWYKRNLKETVLGKVYANQNKVKGVDQDPANNQQIYEKYVKAFKKGVFNMIKEEAVANQEQPVMRKYFSGGVTSFDNAQLAPVDEQQAAAAFLKAKGVLETFLAQLQQYKLEDLSVPTKAVATGTLLSLSLMSVQAGNVTLGWNASKDNVKGYAVYYGVLGQGITNRVTAGNTLSVTVSNLTQGTTYIFQAVAYDSNDVESLPSNQTTYTVPIVTINSNQPAFIQDFTVALQPNGKQAAQIKFSIIGATNLNVTTAIVQRSTNAVTWQTIGNVSLQGTGGLGGTNKLQVGSFIDRNPPAGQAYYRLYVPYLGADNGGVFSKPIALKEETTTPIDGQQVVLTTEEPVSQETISNVTVTVVDKNNNSITLPVKQVAANIRSGTDAAMQTKPVATVAETRGGIDFDATNLDMLIKRDGKGMVLPVNQQDLDKINIEGLVPQILDIKSAGDLPFLNTLGASP